MINTTLCYITRGDEVLMLHRVKKKNDINKDKWIGIGGKFEGDESPDACLLREAKEETGLTLTDWHCHGVVTFITENPADWQHMYLFSADGFEGNIKTCDEGDLQWVSREFVRELPKWEGDDIFLRLMWENVPFFLLTLRYQYDVLEEAVLNGKKMQKDANGVWTSPAKL
jgi:8-oxo-dGTP diphosphatase